MKTIEAEPNDDLMTSTQVAEYFSVTGRTIKLWKARGLIPYVKIGGTVRFKRSTITGFAEEKQNL